MKQLKQEILRHELSIEMKKDRTLQQYKELKTNFQHKISSPIGLGIAFIVGFVSLYRMNSPALGPSSTDPATGLDTEPTSDKPRNKLTKFPWITALQVANRALGIAAKFIR
jgi:hypothetical protein